MSNAPEVRRADQSMSHDATLKSLQEGYSPRSTAVFHAHAKNHPCPPRVIYRNRRCFRLMSALRPKADLVQRLGATGLSKESLKVGLLWP